MNVIILPTYSDVYYTYSIGLEGKKFTLSFLWNDRDNAWRMSIRKEDLTPVVLGYKLVSSYPMMADYALQDDGLSGYFALIPNSNDNYTLNDQPSSLSQYYTLFYIYE